MRNHTKVLFSLAMTALVIMVTAGVVVHAGTMIGPNFEIISETGALFSGVGGSCEGGTTTLVASATDPGFATSGVPTPCSAFSVTQSGIISVVALNGYEIDAISGSVACGVTGGDSLSFSLGSLVLTCPTEGTVGATGPVSGEITFAPVTSLAETVTLSNTFTTGGSSSISSSTTNFLLVASVPEPSSFLLLSIGLVGLGFMKWNSVREAKKASHRA